ncbi:MAG: ABC transporter substrate-binding protein [Flavobacteriaceae bacterium]|nr:ABC transporter substrate-binding protein [Flavobacteriaceae bacterium]
MKKLTLVLCLTLALVACKDNKDTKTTDNQVATEQPKSTERIVSLNGTITEILVDLGQQKNIVGVDVTSTFPTDISNTATQLEHVSKINIEALLGLQPTIVYVAKKDLNENLQKQLETANIKLVIVEQEYSVKGTKQLVKDIATSLQLDNATEVITKIDNETKDIKPLTSKPKVLFIYARGASTLLVAGEGTPMEKMIQLAGGENAITGFSDFKPLTPEALLNSNPDYILMFDTGLQSMGGIDGVLKIEGIEKTNAGKNKKVIAMDGLLLTGFTPRIGTAITSLNHLLSE